MTVLNVKDMMCQHCVSSIEGALKEAGIKARVNLDVNTVEIDNDADVDQAMSVIDEIGFTPEKA